MMVVFVDNFGEELKWRGKYLIFCLIPILYVCVAHVCLHA